MKENKIMIRTERVTKWDWLRSFWVHITVYVKEKLMPSTFNFKYDFPAKSCEILLQVWSVQVPCGAQYHNAVQLLLEQLDILKRLIVSQSEYTKIVTSSQGEYYKKYKLV